MSREEEISMSKKKSKPPEFELPHHNPVKVKSNPRPVK
jgi:hypothetical protein